MLHLVTVLDWYGPFGYDEAFEIARKDFDGGMYLCVGKVKSQHGPATIQYVGIAGKVLRSRVNGTHAKLILVTRERNIWLGEIGSLGVPGKKAKKTNASLDFAEWALVYFLKPRLNNKKTKTPPARPVTVLNRWWKRDYATQHVRRPHPNWPDLIDYLGPESKARVVWFKGAKRIQV